MNRKGGRPVSRIPALHKRPARTSRTTASKSWGLAEPAQYSSMTVRPRPTRRPQRGSEHHVPEPDRRRALETKADRAASRHPAENEKPPQDPEEEYRSSVGLNASGDGQTSDALHETQVSQEEAIMDGQPPWERAEAADSTFPLASEGSARAQSARSTKSSCCCIFKLFCILPAALLLLGGLGQHMWHYGLPLSVAQLTAQLQLHWLEGFVPELHWLEGFVPELHWLEGFVPEPCSADCRVQLVESIPVGLDQSLPSSRRSIADSWLRLLDMANSSVQITAFYFSLRGGDSQGRQVFEHLKGLKSKGVTLQIAVNGPQTSREDTAELAAAGAEVREVDLQAVTGGIVHTKLWVLDQKHFYLGSANMDWRSLSQVKEVGLSVENCSCLARDASRLFGVYWSIGAAVNGFLPPYWPARLSALSSSQNPLRLKFNGVPARVYLSSAPPQISARGRSDDLSAILSVITDARSFIHISVMDYLPLSQYTEPLRFWPAIDSALRAAACTRGVQVRLLVSCWKHSPGPMFPFLQSLLVLGRPQLKCDIDVKMFTVPSTAEQMEIPFARVNHAKYMVTDRVVYIGTSNWSENYFTHTAGAGVVVNQTGSVIRGGQQTLQSQAGELFLRDWTSHHASRLSVDDMDVCPRSAL
ncbi:5'-3' exonuclease PLD3-like isoform X2 [Clinocottus analis]